MKCRTTDCQRTRLTHAAFCSACVTALLERVFGRTAEYPVRTAA